MKSGKNVLFIMCDQLRWDYLSCYGHPYLHTPNIDALAARGVRFERAYAQSTICGPSRMSFYTGRYVRSHGSTWNGFPLRVGEPTLGDYLRPLGVRTAVVGKTHMRADQEGMRWLGLDPASTIGTRVAECGFEPYERDDGLHPHGPFDPDGPYNAYLNAQGFGGDNPWNDWANAVVSGDRVLSGWYLSHARKPARIPEEHSETAYITRRAMNFIAEAGGEPWCLHLSYIKPHWPYIAPAPYNDMYAPAQVLPVVRSARERAEAHPVFRAFMNERVSQCFSRDEVRHTVIPTYMGLVKQIDDHLGRLMRFLDDRGLMENTMIVFTSDHGDYLGDHWLGEKELFHDTSVRIPLIVYDPRPEAGPLRGTTCDALVEGIDLAPTFVEFCGGEARPHVLEGRALTPLLHGRAGGPWRPFVVSEYDYAMRRARLELGVPIPDAHMTMIFDGRWKCVLTKGFREMLFDLTQDPQEMNDLGGDPGYRGTIERLREHALDWALGHHNRVTVSDEMIASTCDKEEEMGIIIGRWSE